MVNASDNVTLGAAGLGLEQLVLQVQLLVMSLMGTTGNALVLFVFSRTKEELVSTTFILVLACVDFVTCFVVIPFTMYMEYVDFRIGNDIICKSYEFLIASHIPFSALIMICIAIDRYVCICRPLAKLFTFLRAKVVALATALAATVLGIFASLTYGVYAVRPSLPVYLEEEIIDNATQQPEGVMEFPSVVGNFSVNYYLAEALTDPDEVIAAYCRHLSDIMTQNRVDPTNVKCPTVSVVYTQHCQPTQVIFSKDFLTLYSICYHTIFATCLVIAFILYALTYRSVLRHRRGQQKRRSKCLEMVVVVNQQGTSSQSEPRRESLAGSRRASSSWCRERLDSFFSEAAKRSYARYRANAKTAAMLFVVTLVFAVSYIPALLILFRAISHNNNLFYMYFVNNASNPIIYSFMNRNFRDNLKTALKKLRRDRRRF